MGRTLKAIGSSNPYWYKDAVIYQLHVRAFCDKNGDGIGDFAGLTERLGYLKDLGVTALWLLPFYPSPLKDDGYDIADYTDINPMYGSKADFKKFLKEAHRLDLKVITELVMNHTSDQHPWFQRARKAPAGSPERDFYVWSDSPERYKDARIIFKDFEASNWTWDPVAKSYYWHRFYSNQPDLNFNNPQVQKAMLKVLDLWFEMGVDGLRLDAVPYLFEDDDTNCENLPQTHEFLKKLRRYVDERHQDKMLLAEANQWPEDAMAYFGKGDECHMCFHFPLMPRMYMALEMEDRFPVVDILGQTPEIPGNSQWAIFLRNHDELTLEMVTDEERDYMYRVYASDARAKINLGIRRRLAPLLGNNRHKIELLKGLLFSLPGTPIVYYGDEIGMGDNIYLGDRNGVRTPLQWEAGPNAGFSEANPQQLYLPVIVDHEFHYEAINIETQQKNSNSLLWWVKRLIALRKDSPALRRGNLRMLHPRNQKVLCFIREHEGERVLVVANMSRNAQCVELDLSEFQGLVPQEMFGQSAFPPIDGRPYFISMGPHQFYWFRLQKNTAHQQPVLGSCDWAPELHFQGTWEQIFDDLNKSKIEKILPSYLERTQWYPSKDRMISSTVVQEFMPLATPGVKSFVALIRVHYLQGEEELFSIPVTAVFGSRGREIETQHPRTVIARVRHGESGEYGVLVDALADREFRESFLTYILRSARSTRTSRTNGSGARGTARTKRSEVLLSLFPEKRSVLEALEGPIASEIGESTITYGDKLFVKIIRRVESGQCPEAEIGRFFSKKPGEFAIADYYGALECPRADGQTAVLAVLQSYIPNRRNMWNYTLDLLGRYYEGAQTRMSGFASNLMDEKIKAEALDLLGSFVPGWTQLGYRTAELHEALAEPSSDSSFAPDRFTELYQRALYQSIRVRACRSFEKLKEMRETFAGPTRQGIEQLLGQEDRIYEELKTLFRKRITGLRIRYHGDFCLKNIFFTGRDFVVTNFEGELSRPWSEQKIKRSPLFDVAALLRSFHYAASVALEAANIREEDRQRLAPWKNAWVDLVSETFLNAYFKRASEGKVYQNQNERKLLLRFYYFKRAFRELERELTVRPEHAWIPVEGILRHLSPSAWDFGADPVVPEKTTQPRNDRGLLNPPCASAGIEAPNSL